MLSFCAFPAKNANASEVVTLRAKGVNMQASTKVYGTMVVIIHKCLNLALDGGVLSALGSSNFASTVPTYIL